MGQKKFFTIKEASQYMKDTFGIQLKPNTLNNWRHQEKGPKYYNRFGKIYYDKKDLDQFIDETFQS